MNKRVELSVFYPYPVEKVWQALTDRRILNTWMMNNNFEPHLGHKFKFKSEIPGIKTVIHCEVVELDKPKRLAYTWQDEITSEPTLVVWTLTPVEGGTQLQLKHLQTGYAMVSIGDRQQISNSHNLYQQPIAFHQQSQIGLHQIVKDELNSLSDRPFKENWDYRLNCKLSEALTHCC